MDKLIKLGVEAKKHDTKISQIERQIYNTEISEEEGFELMEKELVRHNKEWASIINFPVINREEKDRLIMKDHFCLDNEYGNDCEYCNNVRHQFKTN